MLISRVIASFFGTNCWILAGEAGGECVIVDPGIAVPDLVGKILDKTNGLGLKPVAALITHGHLDHTFSLYPLCRESGMKGAYVRSSQGSGATDSSGDCTSTRRTCDA